MIALNKLCKIGYGFGYGYQKTRNVTYTAKHLKALKSAILVGYNFIDTAREYGSGGSENTIGLLDRRLKKKIFISTKVSPQNLGFNNFIISVLESANAMKVNTIDLIQPHWPNPNIEDDEIIDAFNYLKSKKIVRYFGLSNYSLDQIKYFKKKMKNNLKFIQDEFSIQNRFAENKIKYCIKNKMFFIGYSPLKSIGVKKKEIKKISQDYKISIHQLYLTFLNRYKNTLLLPRSFNTKHIKENINSKDIKLKNKDFLLIKKLTKKRILSIKIDSIIIPKNKNFIQNIFQAKKIKFSKKNNVTPSDLARQIFKNKNIVKPIILKKKKNKLYLKEGQIRFWATRIAYGNKTFIRSIIYE